MVEAARERYVEGESKSFSGRHSNNIENLNRSERETLKKLGRLTLIIEDLYKLQKSTSFYPDGMTRDAILAIGEKNPDVLSSWTYVETKNGETIAVPYHEKFKRESRAAASAAHDAAKSIDDRETQKILTALSTAFTKGTWLEFEEAWLTEDWPPNIDVFAGPIEPHMDKLLGKKAVFEIVVGHIDRAATEKRRRFVELALAVQKGRDVPRVQIRVDNVYFLGGFLKELEANAFALPNDPERVEQYGSKIVFLQNRIEDTCQHTLFPVINAIFEEELVGKYEPIETTFLEASEDWLSLHEISHPLVQHPSKRDRFQEYYAPLDELHCDVSALNLARELREHNLISPRRFERIVMVHMANKFVDYAKYKILGVEEKEPYARGSVTELNFLFAMAGLTPDEKGKFGLYREDEITEASEDLLGQLDYLAKIGTHADVALFFRRFGNLRTMSQFDKQLKQALNRQEQQGTYQI